MLHYFASRLYPFAFILAASIMYFFLRCKVHNSRPALHSDQAKALVVYLIISFVVGSRLLFIVVDTLPGVPHRGLQFYLNNPAEPIQLWHGGLSFYGGLCLAIVVGLAYARKNMFDAGALADATVISAPLSMAVGRISNYAHRTLPGRQIPGSLESYPWQIFEAIGLTFIVFPILIFTFYRTSRPYSVLSSFLISYAMLRFIVDFTRADVRYGSLSLGQYFSLIALVSGIILLTKTMRCST